MRVTDPSGSTESVVRDPAIAPAWSPDGRSIAFSISGEGGPQRIWTMRGDGSKAAPLTDGRPDGYETSPKWFPDGKTIAFTSARNEPGPGATESPEVVLTDLDGVTTTLTAGASPSWSPDGRQLVYVHLEDFDLWVINSDGTGSQLLVAGVTAADLVLTPAWRPRIRG